MKKLSLFIFIASLLLFNSSVLAQEKQEARLFDSWGRANSEDASARLDNFAVALQDSPGLRAYLICYGPEGEGSGTGKFILKVLNDYLVNLRGIDPERLEMIYGGRYKDPVAPRIEAWLVPYGAASPEPAHFESKPAVRRGKVEEHIGSDDISGIDECGCGPPQGNVALAALADALRMQADDVVYIAAFNLKSSAPGTWLRVAEQESHDVQSYGVEADRIKIIFGGKAASEEEEEDESSGRAKVEIWVLPKDSPPPVKEAKAEPTLKQSLLLGEYNQYSLMLPEDKKRVFDRLVDVLKVDQSAILCLIVRPSAPPAEPSEVLPSADEPPDVDTVKLVEKWRTELIEKLGIKTNRIVLIPAPADDEGIGSIEVWVIPPGAELPNPRRTDDSDKPDPRNTE